MPTLLGLMFFGLVFRWSRYHLRRWPLVWPCHCVTQRGVEMKWSYIGKYHVQNLACDLYGVQFHVARNRSMQEYEDRAVMLATDADKLHSLTTKLRSTRMTCPLFDTSRWVGFLDCFIYLCFLHEVAVFQVLPYKQLLCVQVQNLERAFFKMWNLYCEGNHPQPFKVLESDDFPYDQ